jgi:Lrp/AsnC family transcriptional regulator, leucine-responsive regulatory protein
MPPRTDDPPPAAENLYIRVGKRSSNHFLHYPEKVSRHSCGETATSRIQSREKRVSLRYSAFMPQELDDTDLQILDLIQSDARRPADAIGQLVNLSASAVQRRISRLRDDGVIVGEIALLEPKAVGRPLVMIVDVELERERPNLLADFKRWLLREPAIQQAWYVTGGSDYVLVVTAVDVDSYDSLMQKLVTDNPNVRKFGTRVALKTLKRGFVIPLTQRHDKERGSDTGPISGLSSD